MAAVKKQLLLQQTISVYRSSDDKNIVGPLDIQLHSGEILCLIGESGSGKTLTLRSIAGILPHNLADKGKTVARSRTVMLFQDPMSYFNPYKKIRSSLHEVLKVIMKVPRKERAQKAVELIQEVGLQADDLQRYPFQLSGGMAQRAALALSLAVEPQVLLIDEIGSALDKRSQMQLFQLLTAQVKSRSIAAVMVSHDISRVAGYVHKVLVMYAGAAVEAGGAKRLLGGSAHHPYTDMLTRIRVGKETHGRLLAALPHRSVPAAGCVFAARCPKYKKRCVKDMPPVVRSTQQGQRESIDWHRCFFPIHR